ncbi:glycosyltransferase family 39 protein [Synechococcus sp. W60.1]|uniref:ArnT family glycosyltransferase n=1 Tax=Synechococcus sp. W60.1 TaxID=2964516 RepID=UPI0039C2E4C9
MPSFLGRLKGSLGMGLLAGLWLWVGQGIPYLFDWDELIYASLARQMLASGDPFSLAINGEPFFEKPPLFFWLQALSMAVLGMNEGAVRLPNAFAGGITVALLVGWGSCLGGMGFGCLWGILLLTGYLPLFFYKTGLIDPLLNLGMGVGLGSLWAAEEAWRAGYSGRRWRAVGALALGLAVLAKGPVGLVLPLAIWILYKLWQRDPPLRWGESLVFLSLAVAVPLTWLALEGVQRGPEWVEEFGRYQWRILTSSDGHPGPVYFHLLAFALGCFPWGSLALAEILQPIPRSVGSVDLTRRAESLLLVAFGVVLALFSLLVQTKLVHYTSLLYPIGAYFAALRLQRLVAEKRGPSFWESAWILLSGLFWLALWLLLPWLGSQDPAGLVQAWVFAGIPDDFSSSLVLGYLQAEVEWPVLTYVPAAILLLGILLWSRGRRRAWGWTVLLLATGLSAQLAWCWVFPRLLQHTQGGAVHFFRQFATSENNAQPALSGTVGLYGFRSFVPYFYGPLQVPYAASRAGLADWQARRQMPDYLVTWDPFVAELAVPDNGSDATLGSWQALERRSPFWLLKASPHFSSPP